MSLSQFLPQDTEKWRQADLHCSKKDTKRAQAPYDGDFQKDAQHRLTLGLSIAKILPEM